MVAPEDFADGTITRHVPPAETEEVNQVQEAFVQGEITVNETEARIENELTTAEKVPLTEAI